MVQINFTGFYLLSILIVYSNSAYLIIKTYGCYCLIGEIMSLRGSDEKISLIQFLNKYAYKEEVQNILDSLDLTISGTKDDLLNRLKPKLASIKQREILDILSKDSLKNACDDYNLMVSGTKEDLINRIIKDVLISSSPKEKTSCKKVDEPNYVSFINDIDGLIGGFDKTDLKNALSRNNLSTTGSIDELRNRLLSYSNYDPRKTLEMFGGDVLSFLAEIINIPRRRSKEDQINEFMILLFGGTKNEEMPAIKTIIKKDNGIIFTPSTTNSHNIDNNLFNCLVRDIESYSPHKRYSKEEGYQADLNGYLCGKGYSTRMEAGSSRADILVNECIPLELKKSPGSQAYSVMFGEIHKHAKAHGCAIGIIFDVDGIDKFLDFQDDVKASLSKWPIKIMKNPV